MDYRLFLIGLETKVVVGILRAVIIADREKKQAGSYIIHGTEGMGMKGQGNKKKKRAVLSNFVRLIPCVFQTKSGRYWTIRGSEVEALRPFLV